MMGELGRDWLRGVGVTVPVTGGGAQPSLAVMLATVHVSAGSRSVLWCVRGACLVRLACATRSRAFPWVRARESWRPA
jgi:hypothetical protein